MTTGPTTGTETDGGGGGGGSDATLDVRGLTCPLPVLKANKALRALAPGARLVVLATDPASVKDFRVFAAETGHALVGFSEAGAAGGGTEYRFTLRKRAAAAAEASPEGGTA